MSKVVSATIPDLSEWRAEARVWLERNVPPADEAPSYAVFHSLSDTEERALLEASAVWQRRKQEAGYGAISWPEEFGGADLPADFERAFREEEASFRTPPGTELVSVTLDLVAPTILEHGTYAQQAQYLPAILGGELWASQLFSEPGAGSDLAALRCSAEPVDGGWLVNGQKVWSSGTRFAHFGELIARSDPASKHGGLTAFLLPLDSPGIEIRPIKQMTGGGSFNEVFLTNVFVPDSLRLGEVGQGWAVTMTTLRHERASSGWGAARVGAQLDDVLRLATGAGPVMRGHLAALWCTTKVQSLFAARVRHLAMTGELGFEGSILKLLWVRNLDATTHVLSMLLGMGLIADVDYRYAFSEHVLGAPGYGIAGGSNEIQRTIIGERLLGLPREPSAG